MTFLEKLHEAKDIFFPTEDKINEDKGREFERYIGAIFASHRDYFTILEWTNDVHDKRRGITVESNKNPDLLIQYKPVKEKFAVECKYRSGLYKSNKIDDYVLRWTYPAQLERYREYERRNKIPVFIVVGLHGKPSDPEFCFCIPLQKAKYVELFPSILDKYVREPKNKKFFWKNGTLT